MFSLALQIFIENRLYGGTLIESKNSVVNKTNSLCSCGMHSVVEETWLTMNYTNKCLGTRRKAQDAVAGRPLYSGIWRKTPWGTAMPSWHWGKLTERSANTRPVLGPASSLFSFPLLSFPLQERRAFSLHRKQDRVTPLHLTIGLVGPVWGNKGKRRWPTWPSFSVICSPLSFTYSLQISA